MIDYVIANYRTPELAEIACETVRERAEVWSTVSVIDAYERGLSYAGAISAGLAMLDEPAPYMCALNADVECLESQKVIVDLFEQHPEVAVIGPLQIDSYGYVRHAGIFGGEWDMELAHRFWGEPYESVKDRCAEELLDCQTVSGSVLYARREVWDELGGFLLTRHFYEETFFNYKARHRGYRVCFTAAAGPWIHNWDSSPVSQTWKDAAFAESRMLFIEACAEEGIPLVL